MKPFLSDWRGALESKKSVSSLLDMCGGILPEKSLDTTPETAVLKGMHSPDESLFSDISQLILQTKNIGEKNDT
jgi:hypothetical protein